MFAESVNLGLELIFVFVFCHTRGLYKFLGQGLGPSCSCGLRHSYGKARSLTHYTGPGIKPAPQQWLKPLRRQHGIPRQWGLPRVSIYIIWPSACHLWRNVYSGLLPYLFIYLFIVFSGLLGPHPRHMEVPGLGVQSELLLPAYTTATATPDPSHVCDLHHSSWQCRILNTLSKASNQTYVFMDASQIRFCWATTGTPFFFIFKIFLFNWNLVNSQCCGDFCCTTRWFNYIYIRMCIYMYAYMHSFSYSFPL